jgi:hypothetical protein
MKRRMAGLIGRGVALGILAATTVQADYSANPLVRTLKHQQFEVKGAAQFDFADNDHDTVGWLGGMGWRATELWTLGIYGSIRGSERRLPTRMHQMYGLGLYADVTLFAQDPWTSFAEARIGMLDPSGPFYPTSMHLAGLLGVRWALTQRMQLSLAGVAQWATHAVFNYEATADGNSFAADRTDFGIEAGMRFAF